MEVGPKTVVAVAHRLGIQSDLTANASIALGTSEVTPLELTAAYVPFANGGYKPTVHFVRRILSSSGKVLYAFPHKAEPRVIRPEIVGMMNSMMRQTILHGTARRAAFGWPAAGKTGTSQDSRDAWFVGYTANLTTGVWFGNDDNSPTKGVTGGSLPATAWKEFMTAAHEGVPMRDLPGSWHPAPDVAVAPVTVSEDEDQTPLPTIRPSAPASSVGVVASGSAQLMPPADVPHPAARSRRPLDASRTASVSRPVPPADVGGAPRRAGLSILDVILGRD
jgi:penicillin-binding protein 1A